MVLTKIIVLYQLSDLCKAYDHGYSMVFNFWMTPLGSVFPTILILACLCGFSIDLIG